MKTENEFQSPNIDRLKYLLVQAQSKLISQEELSELLAVILQDESGEVIAEIDVFHKSDGEMVKSEIYDYEFWHLVVTEVLDTDKGHLD